jgi:RimJ/RimL family protein N-acetyltransferase
MRLVPYSQGDEAHVKARADFCRDFREAGGRLPIGPKMTLKRPDGEIVGVCGFSRLAYRQWGAWAYLAPLRPREWLKAVDFARVVCAWASALLEFNCQIFATPADAAAARRTLARIGFRQAPGEDDGVFIYSEGA